MYLVQIILRQISRSCILVYKHTGPMYVCMYVCIYIYVHFYEFKSNERNIFEISEDPNQNNVSYLLNSTYYKCTRTVYSYLPALIESYCTKCFWLFSHINR